MKKLATISTLSLFALSSFAGIRTVYANDIDEVQINDVERNPRAPDAIRMNLLLDLSGSMGGNACTLNGDSLTRLDVAKRVAAGWIKRKLESNGESVGNARSKVAIWTFVSSGDTDYFNSVVSYTDPQSALDQLEAISLPTGNGATPLAGSVCRVLDELTAESVRSAVTSGSLSTRNLPQHHFFVATDGEENSTPKNQQCYGKTSQLTAADTANDQWFPDFEAWSWQHKVAQKFLRFGNSAGVLIQDESLPTPVVDALYILPKMFFGHTCSDLPTRRATMMNQIPSRSFPTAAFLSELSKFSRGHVQMVVPDPGNGAVDIDALISWDGPDIGQVINIDGLLNDGFINGLIQSPFAIDSGLSDELIKWHDLDIPGGGGHFDIGQFDIVDSLNPVSK